MMIGLVYNEAWVPSALRQQCVYTWYRLEDATVILVFTGVP
jgi:hypothetical protein